MNIKGTVYLSEIPGTKIFRHSKQRIPGISCLSVTGQEEDYLINARNKT